jgi:hypothetical protein
VSAHHIGRKPIIDGIRVGVEAAIGKKIPLSLLKRIQNPPIAAERRIGLVKNWDVIKKT